MSSPWTKIHSYSSGDGPPRTLGLNASGQFVVGTADHLTLLKEPKDYVALLSLLETDKTLFEQALRSSHVKEEKIAKLKSALYQFGLTVSPYWSERVIDWIGLDEINEDLKPILNSALSNTRISQSLRHRVRKMLRG